MDIMSTVLKQDFRDGNGRRKDEATGLAKLALEPGAEREE